MNKVAIGGLMILFMCLMVGMIAQVVKLGEPAIVDIKHHLCGTQGNMTRLITDITVDNPNPLSIPLERVEATISMNNIEIGRVTSVDGMNIGPSRRTVLRIATAIDDEKVRTWWVSHVNNGEHTMVKVQAKFLLDLGLTTHEYPITALCNLNTDLMNAFRFRSTEPASIRVRNIEAHFGSVDTNETDIIIEAAIANRDDAPVRLSDYRYQFMVNGVLVGQGCITLNKTLQPGTATKVRFKLPLQTAKIANCCILHMVHGEITEMGLKIEPQIDIHAKRCRYSLIEGDGELKTSLMRELFSSVTF